MAVGKKLNVMQVCCSFKLTHHITHITDFSSIGKKQLRQPCYGCNLSRVGDAQTVQETTQDGIMDNNYAPAFTPRVNSVHLREFGG